MSSGLYEWQLKTLVMACAVGLLLGMLIFENLISRYENFQSRDSSSTRYLTWDSGAGDALNAWMLWQSRHDAVQVMQLWLGGNPWIVQQQGKLRWSQITKRDHLSHVLVSYQTWRQTTPPAPNNEQPESLWQVTGWAGPCVQFNGGISVRLYSGSANLNWLQMQCW